MVVARDVVTITKEAAKMVNYREILRLSNDPQNGQRSIAAALHCSRDTIREVRVAAEKAGVSWPLDDTVTNEMLKRILFPEKSTAETLYTQPNYPYIHKELARPGVNLTLLWTEYCRRCENDGMGCQNKITEKRKHL